MAVLSLPIAFIRPGPESTSNCHWVKVSWQEMQTARLQFVSLVAVAVAAALAVGQGVVFARLQGSPGLPAVAFLGSQAGRAVVPGNLCLPVLLAVPAGAADVMTKGIAHTVVDPRLRRLSVI